MAVVHLYRIAGYYFTLLMFAAGGLLLNVFSSFAFLVPATDRTERFFQRLIHRAFRLFIRWMALISVCRVSYDRGFGEWPKGTVIVANHPGLMDITYLLARLPEAICIFKPAIRRNPVLGSTGHRAGYVVSGEGVDTVRAAAGKVAAGHTMIIFPEGTRTPANALLGPLRPGFAVIALRGAAPVQVLRIHCDSSVLTKRRAWWKPPQLPIGVRIEVGPRLVPRPEDTALTLTSAVEEWLFAGAEATDLKSVPGKVALKRTGLSAAGYRRHPDAAGDRLAVAAGADRGDWMARVREVMIRSSSHLVLLPTFNTGPRLATVVEEVLQHWSPVLVVVDGSTDGSAETMQRLAEREPNLAVLVLPQNCGKGAAVLEGARWARTKGFTHALVMDADGQHPAQSIAEFMSVSLARPDAMVLGRPQFPPNIPRERLYGRQISIGLVHCEVLGRRVADPLFGFRVYPIAPLLATFDHRQSGRRYDFDTEAAVRLVWAGAVPVNVPAPVRYFSRADGGVSHFHYLRDNLGLIRLHAWLLLELVFWRWPRVLLQRRAQSTT